MKLNKLLNIAAASAAFTLCSNSHATLILTGLFDGPLSGGTPKAIELFALADIADLSAYGVELASNADFTQGAAETFFSGSASAGDYIYVTANDAEFTSVFGFAANFITGDVNHNGDDDFYIYGPGDTLIDVWSGSDGVDNTGTESDILDSWAYRLNDTGPNPVFTASEWTIAPVDSLDGLDAAGTAAAIPFGTYTNSAVPEPSAYAFLAGLTGLAFVLARRRRA
jgi:hypothetical protein